MSRGMTPVHLPCSCFLPPSSSSWILEAEESQQRKHRRSPGSRLNTDTTAAATLITALSPPYIVCHLLATHRTASLSSPSPFPPLCFAGKDHKISEIKWNGCLGMDMSLATWSGTWGNRRISCSFAEDCCCRALFFQTLTIYAGSWAVKTHISPFWCLAHSLLMRGLNEWMSRELKVIMAVKNN